MIKQRGGFLVGLLIGLMIGLAMALGVALYVAKVPVPFMNKVPQRTAAEDAAEAKRNKTWDPNAPLINRGARPNTTSASGQVTTETEYPAGGTDPVTAAKAPQAASGAASAAPAPTATTDDGMAHYVQVGAYARVEDAETQKARLGLIGFDTKVSEREQAGRRVYRVRIGPFDTKDQAEATKASLDGVGVEASLVRVQK
jgi:cell division protein FtsN